MKYKLYCQVIYRKRIFTIVEIIDRNWIFIANSRGKLTRVKDSQLRPLGYILIKNTRNGKFRYHTVSWNNEKLQTSEPLDSKAHVIRMAKKYFSSFHIIDKTV